MSHKEKAKELLKERDRIDEKIAELFKVLETNGVTMDTPLVDAEEFPLPNIDVYSVRHAKHEIICLRNDREELTKKITAEMEARDPDEPSELDINKADITTQPVVHRTSNNPFARVSDIVESSPAYEDGFRKEDRIIQYGTLHYDNFTSLSDLAKLTAASENQIIRVTVIREDRPVRLEIRPRKWSGPGLLGCKIAPLTGATV